MNQKQKRFTIIGLVVLILIGGIGTGFYFYSKNQTQWIINNDNLLRAVGDGNLKETQEAIRAGADVNMRRADDSTILSLAAEQGNLDIVKELIKDGADVNGSPSDGQTILMRIADLGSLEVVKELIKDGINVNAKDDFGLTALASASMNCRADVAKELISAGADVNAKDNKGKTVLESLSGATGDACLEFINILKTAGAKLNKQLPKKENPATNQIKKLSLEDWKVENTTPTDDNTEKLVLINRLNGEEKVIFDHVSDIRKAICEKFTDTVPLLCSRGVLGITGYPNKGSEIYFTLAYEYGGPIFAVDINTREIRKIKEDSMRLSFAPTGDKAVYAESVNQIRDFGNIISLVCLNNDTTKQLIVLKNGEILNKFPPELEDGVDIKWLSENEIQYNVYTINPEQKLDTFLDNNFNRIEKLVVPDC